jgi:hypothetical protein
VRVRVELRDAARARFELHADGERAAAGTLRWRSAVSAKGRPERERAPQRVARRESQ